jgi:hypothetical protein
VSLTLYSHPFASYCQKVLIALWENEVPFTYRHLEEPGGSHSGVVERKSGAREICLLIHRRTQLRSSWKASCASGGLKQTIPHLVRVTRKTTKGVRKLSSAAASADCASYLESALQYFQDPLD